MKTILGITAEYDPFHNGHAHQIARARELTDPAAVVVVMSGPFTQRGEPAILDLYARAQLAAARGADLVVELPFVYACRQARDFAAGAVDLLAAAGATHISYGCEAREPEKLEELARLQVVHGAALAARTAEHKKTGCSHAKASELAARELLGDDLTDLTLQPNNILALEYLKQIAWQREQRGRDLVPVPIRRAGSGYRDADAQTGFAGATVLRQRIAAGESIAGYVPYDPAGMAWTDLPAARQRLYEQVRGQILRMDAADLAQGCGIGEGMEHRLRQEAVDCETYERFLQAMTSRRYTASAIRRIMVWLLLGVRDLPRPAPYGRVLAANETGRRLLRRLQDAGSLPVVSGNRMPEGMTSVQRQSVDLDARASHLYNLICGRSLQAWAPWKQRPRML